MNRLIVGIGLILLVLAVTFGYSLASSAQIKETWSQSDQKSLVSISHETVKANGYSHVTVDIAIQGRDDYRVEGQVREITGKGITFIIFDKSNFQSWVNGTKSVQLLSLQNTTGKDFSFSPEKSGDYEFVFDNRNSPIEKEISISATSYWKETKTETSVRWMDLVKISIESAWTLMLILLILGLVFCRLAFKA